MVQGDLEHLPFRDAFDVVCNEGVIEHWLTDEGLSHVISQMVQAARPGGLILIWIPNAHHRFYQPNERVPTENPPDAVRLRSLLEAAGLERVHIFGHRPYRSMFVYDHRIKRLEALGVLLWFLERLLPEALRERLALKYGYQLVGSGYKPGAAS